MQCSQSFGFNFLSFLTLIFLRLKKSVEGMKGATQVEVEPKQSKLAVIGYVDPNKVLHRTGKKADFWPYLPYDVVPHPSLYSVQCSKR
ncbi:hypothetical protein L6164_020189 [Bauhinia variegata]|uniref:Uncharacterized protein n=1 Tax=Bauhinia variegata TaxID=167791 RepID=A0ACB9MV29_BAUVA|nr:hypothetical protein L6164_020189 [Bauhinia variegata]